MQTQVHCFLITIIWVLPETHSSTSKTSGDEEQLDFAENAAWLFWKWSNGKKYKSSVIESIYYDKWRINVQEVIAITSNLCIRDQREIKFLPFLFRIGATM